MERWTIRMRREPVGWLLLIVASFFKLNCRNQKDMDVQWNELDGSIDRRSHNGRYEVVNGLPR